MSSPELIMDEFREAKTKLKSYTVENGYARPEYETVSKREENYRKIYKVRVIIDGLVDITGEGYSRRLAEYRAAINALNEIKEVREEQKKSKAEELAKDKSNGDNSDQNKEEEVVTNGINGDKQSSSEDIQSDKQLNGDHNIDNNSENIENKSNENQNITTNSITISADINTSAEEVKDTEPRVNGHNKEYQSQSSSDSSTNNQINGENNNKSDEVIDKNREENSSPIKIYRSDGQSTGFVAPITPTNRTFQPLSKSPVQKLQDFCMKKQSAFPFYDTTYRDQTFRIKCRIEFNEDEEKREFYGTGSGYTSKEAKIKAAEDVIQQLTELNLM